MITIKLPYKASSELYELVDRIQRQYSSMVRYAYNRFLDGLTEKDIRHFSKSLNNIDLLNSWLIQCAIKEANQIFKRNKDNKVIFGGKYFFTRWIKTHDKQWLDRWRDKRTFPFVSQGERLAQGNRMFRLDIIDNNTIVFKYNRTQHYNIQLPKLRKNIKNKLFKLEEIANQKLIPFTIKLDTKYIYITFDEKLLYDYTYEPIKNRIAAIDMNPNQIGFIVKDFNTNRIIHKEVISIKDINDKYEALKDTSSTDKRKIKINNKRRHEIIHIAKYLSNKAIHYRCEVFAIEKLDNKPSNTGFGRRFNRLVNNQWLRSLFIQNLKKRLNLYNLKLIEVYPQYSSTIGCISYPQFPDSVASAIEISRRGYELHNYNKGHPRSVVFPKFDKMLYCQWKDDIASLIQMSNDWKELHRKLKESKLKYRFLLDEYVRLYHPEVFSLYNIKSLLCRFVI